MFRPTVVSDSTIRRLGAAFVLALFTYEVYVVGVDHSNYYLYLIDGEAPFFIGIALAAVAGAWYLLYRYVVASVSGPLATRLVGAAIFCLAITVEYGYQKALGRFTDRVDIETALASTSQQQIASIMMYISTAAAVPCVVFIAMVLFIRPERPKPAMHLILAIGGIIGLFAVAPFVVTQKFQTFAANAFLRTAADFTMSGPGMAGGSSAASASRVPRREVAVPAVSDAGTARRNVVLVIDESTMGDHFSLNGYSRKTTPFLDDLAERRLLKNWGIAAAASTGSRFTFNAIITGLGPDDFPDNGDHKVATFPTLFQFAKAMGYRTHFFDGQMNRYWGANQDDLRYIDAWRGILDITQGRSFETWQVDELLAGQVNQIIGSSAGNFILIFKHGSHIPYHANFPAESAVWDPSYVSTNKFDIPARDELQSVTNAYDNSIRYNVNSFFEKLADNYADLPNGTVIIYTGDHGQTLFANGRSSHGGNTRGEAAVPLFVIGKLGVDVRTDYRASHGNIFPTVLDLIGYPDELRETPRFPSLLRASPSDSRQRFFNPDLGTKVAFD